jgi:hypothetical protein
VLILLTLVANPPAQSVYPLKSSANKRYLVDQNNRPVFLVGDSPHAMFVNLTVSDAATYMANRASYGINVLWVEVLCGRYIANCRADLSTQDGIVPFSTPGDISTPNPVFFSRIDAMVATAAQNGITLLIDTWETGAEMPLLRSNGNTKAFNYGAYLGNRYKDSPNIIWITGNDFQTYSDNTDNRLIQSIMHGIASVDSNHLQTTQLYLSGSHDDALLLPLTSLAAAYTYSPTYAQIYKEYNATPTLPVFMEEANYEGENNLGADPSSYKVLRQQEYWSMLSGALAGQLYGSAVTAYFKKGWQHGLDTPGIAQLRVMKNFLAARRWKPSAVPAYFKKGWQNALDTPGVAQLRIMKNFFTARQWWSLVPDHTHTVVTSGYGTFSASGPIHTNNYVTTARISDGSVVLAYTPASTTLTVDMTKLSGPAAARWFDPSNGTYHSIPGSPFSNAGTMTLTTPGNNSDGDSDWVLVLEAPTAFNPPPSAPTNLRIVP